MTLKDTARAVALLALIAGPVEAGCPQPVKPAAVGLYSGRWYEIARTPNKMQTDCQGSTMEFGGWTSGGFRVVETCHKGSAVGPKQTYNASGHILPASGNAKMKVGYFGGLVSVEYWIVDHADDNAWAIMATSSGRYVWLMSRQPVLSAGERAQAMGRLRALGFDLTRLAFPQQSPIS